MSHSNQDTARIGRSLVISELTRRGLHSVEETKIGNRALVSALRSNGDPIQIAVAYQLPSSGPRRLAAEAPEQFGKLRVGRGQFRGCVQPKVLRQCNRRYHVS